MLPPPADPLLSLVNIPVLSTTLQGWVNAYKEGGWLPKWASPGYRGSMVGTMGDVSLADAIVKGVPGFDKEGAYEAIYKDAFVAPPPSANGMGRECLESYVRLGYIPHGTCSEVVSRTLDYLQSDFAIANAAEVLGHVDDAAILRDRAANYSSMFDLSTGFMRSIDMRSGKFSEPFDEFAWGGDYTEAGPWQYRFSLPYDPAGLAQLYEEAGLDICAVLEEAQTMASIYHIGDYSNQIHEMTEMAVNCWGQYEHNNQPGTPIQSTYPPLFHSCTMTGLTHSYLLMPQCITSCTCSGPWNPLPDTEGPVLFVASTTCGELCATCTSLPQPCLQAMRITARWVPGMCSRR